MLKKIKVQDLVVGMYVHEFCGSWMEHPFWRSGFLLKEARDLQSIRGSSVKEVWIDAGKGLDVPRAVASQTVAEADRESAQALSGSTDVATGRPAGPAQVPIGEEIRRAAKICVQSKEAVMSMFQEVRMGKAIDAQGARQLVEDISGSVIRNPGALISLARLKTADEYTYMHSVAVCAMMIALARELGLDDAQTRAAGLAGLLHDLGKAAMPMEVLNKPGKLTDREFLIIKQHPLKGHDMYLRSPDPDPVVLDVCLHHHEKTDGSGYPKGLTDEQISVFAKMGAVCDVYDAITSNRPYKEGWDPAESLRKMAEWAKGHFDMKIFQAFVKSLGIYPVGSLVRMTSGRLGVVVEQAPDSLLSPKVKVFFSTKSNLRIPPEIVDLAARGCTEKIVAREDPQHWKFPDLNELWSGLPAVA